MPSEDREHLPLVLGTEVKEAIPSQDAVETPIQRQRTHVCYEPSLVRKTFFAHADEGWRRIDAGHLAALLDQLRAIGSPAPHPMSRTDALCGRRARKRSSQGFSNRLRPRSLSQSAACR